MKDIYILGIETSCDETSCAIVKNGTTEIATIISTQIDIHKKYGGVVPEIASRNHIVNITMVIEETFKKANMTIKDISAIAVTYGPGLSGSLLIGLEAAKTLSFIHNIPLVPVHHIAGHIYANNLVSPLKFPLIALVVSGGHTDLILMKNHLKFTKLGGTLDDAVGECYDKVARVIGIEYPGGPVIDKLAKTGRHSYNLPTPLNDSSYNFSFSGLKSAVINLTHNLTQKDEIVNKEDLAASFQEVVVDTISKKTFHAIKEYNIKNLVVAGGVSANSALREKLQVKARENDINLTVPTLKYCTDNATMIGAVGYYYYINNKISDLSVNVKSNEELKDVI
ncbi:MAG: tRNA (adenosine(37)-N6)-threonylcarbamoyltransferase complex transferase subunit TsaD [Bacilli bacterium]